MGAIYTKIHVHVSHSTLFLYYVCILGHVHFVKFMTPERGLGTNDNSVVKQ